MLFSDKFWISVKTDNYVALAQRQVTIFFRFGVERVKRICATAPLEIRMVNKLHINPKTIEIELLAGNFIIITFRTKINKTFDEAMKQFGVFIVPAPTVTRDVHVM